MDITLSEFLEAFPIPLHHIASQPFGNPWVFWNENEGSADVGIHMIQQTIKFAFYNTKVYTEFLGQFWAPVTIDGRRLLSTSGQPFAVRHLSNELANYRLFSEKYRYIIDVNRVDNEEENPMIVSGGPATAFLNRMPCMNEFQWITSESYHWEQPNFSVMLPLCLPSQSQCVGVLEFMINGWAYDIGKCVLSTTKAVKIAGLEVFYVHDLIPYKTINRLKHTKDEIEEALKVVCESHNLDLAQVWIGCEDKSHVLLSSSLENTITKRLLAIKLAGYRYVVTKDEHNDLDEYITLCDVTPRGIPGELPLETLQDHKSRYICKLRSEVIEDWDGDFFSKSSAFAICLRSNNTGDFDYAFEFIWNKRPNYVIFLEALILTLKRCLPRFKFASGVELGDELDVIVGECARYSEYGETSHIGETEKLKIFQGKRSLSSLEVTRKTTPKTLPREVIEQQYGKTMKEAAIYLNVSLSTLKRKFKELGIPEWPGPKYAKRNVNDSSIIQVITNEQENGAIQDPSILNLNKNILTIKAAYRDDMIKFHLPISPTTFLTVEKEIGVKLNLIVGSYKLKYLDEDGDWISLISDEDMSDCIKSSKTLDQVVVRLRVIPSPQPTSSSGSFNLFSI